MMKFILLVTLLLSGVPAAALASVRPAAYASPRLASSQSRTFEIPAHGASGLQITPRMSGEYEFWIVGGAYSPWPESSGRNDQWRSLLFLYPGGHFTRGHTAYGPGTPLPAGSGLYLGCLPDMTRQEAAQCGQNSSPVRLYLHAGESLRFVPVDEADAYSDNQGGVTVAVRLVEEPTPIPTLPPPASEVPSQPESQRPSPPQEAPVQRAQIPVPTAVCSDQPLAILWTGWSHWWQGIVATWFG